jgi:hypothetical protein
MAQESHNFVASGFSRKEPTVIRMRFLAPLLAAALLLPTAAGAQPGPYPYYYDSSLRLQVTPKTAEVYVDGYYAGTVDDFDGAFQRLRLESGGREIVLWAQGYKTITLKILLQPNQTFRVRQAMEPLRAGDVQDPKPAAPARPASQP